MGHDLVIRNGTIVDGTGAGARPGDLAVDGDRITAVGDVDARGRREIDAEGHIVTPGFVDIHTHLDAQVGWDPVCSSSCWHGVTSVVAGNCGVTFAPVRAGDHDYLAEMMESVEDIPADAILGGLPWDWLGYAGYLTSLDRLPKGVNIGGYVGHCAVRYHAMGERSLDEGEPATPDDLATMHALVDEAMAGGAMGFSTSRTLRHTVPDGRNVPGTWAAPDELYAIGDALTKHGRGVFGVSPRFDGDGPTMPRVESELAWMTELSRRTGRPLTFNLSQRDDQGDHWRQAIAMVEDANAVGAHIRPQTTARGIGVLFSLHTFLPWSSEPAFRTLCDGPVEQRLAALRDPEVRAGLVAAADDGAGNEGMRHFFVLDPDRDARYDCDPDDSLLAHATRRGVTPGEAFLDLALATEGRVVLSYPLLNQRLDAVSEMLTSDVVVMGLADSGAHVGQIMDASQPTFFLTYWIRERELMPIETAIRRITSDTASFMGIADRGVLRPGAFADVNVIDWDGLRLPVPEMAYDFPGGAGRYVQGADGYRATVVNGEVFMEAGEHSGAFAGRVLRSTDRSLT